MTAFEQAQAALFAHHGFAVDSAFVDLPSPFGKTHVLRAGAGDPVLMLHGGNSVAAGLEPLIGAVAGDFEVYAPDRPGCGLTDGFDYRGVDLRAHGAAFVGASLDALGLDRVALVGNSMGGFWCLAFALAHPDRVSRLVLVGEPAGSSRRIGLGFQVLATPGLGRLASRGGGRMSMLVSSMDNVPPPYRDLAAAAAARPGARDAWLSMVRAATRRVGTSPLTYALRPALGTLCVPTLFVWGADDRLGPPSLGREMAALMPDASVIVVDGAGHLPWLDRPTQVAGLITGFLTA